ncbi:hypothetical protein MKW98_020584 [Papaver atlanticum]|uniref:Uncharacterized protein n=1 Tax=Papaver atlanticum TaxID=357466 RepID=A0AAD4SIE2_9MAGN|nr:hypothetical protein MKW98_020584 [Papaver atlanticum]
MAATKTSLVLFLFALIAVSANLQMASAGDLGVTCLLGVKASVQIPGVCPSNDPLYCYNFCKSECPLNLKVGIYACVPGLISAEVNGCSCCYISLL